MFVCVCNRGCFTSWCWSFLLFPHFVRVQSNCKAGQIYHCIVAVATIELVAVGGNSAVCSGASVTLQCTLTGDGLTWNTPNGELNFVRGRASEPDVGSYHGRLQELNSTHLRSNLTFTFTSQITISCYDGSANTSTTISTEGIYCINYSPFMLRMHTQ